MELRIMNKMLWPITVYAETYTPSGKRVRMLRREEGAGDVEAAMLRALGKRKDNGYPFLGCEIRAVTPLGQRVIRVFDPDTRLLVKVF
jgi:hypothetical protein